jgi:hypothetical protein
MRHARRFVAIGILSISSVTCTAVAGHGQSLPSRSIPDGMQSIPTGGSGRILAVSWSGSSSARAMAQVAVRGIQPYFNGSARILNAIGDNADTQIQAAFKARLDGVPVTGLLGVSTQGGAVRAVVLFDASQALPRSIDRLMRVATQGGGTASGGTVVAAQPLTRTRIPDGSGTIGLAQGWRINYAYKGAMDIFSPYPNSGMSLGAVLTVPYTSRDPVQAFVMMSQQNAQRAGKRLEVQILDSRPVQWQQGGRAALIRARGIVDGQSYEYYSLIAITPFQGNQVFYYTSQISAPSESFGRILPTALATWASWSIYPAEIARRMQETARTMRETGELLTGSARSSQRAFDSINLGWSQYMRGVATLEDDGHVRSDVSQSFADDVVRTDPQHYRIVPASELIP